MQASALQHKQKFTGKVGGNQFDQIRDWPDDDSRQRLEAAYAPIDPKRKNEFFVFGLDRMDSDVEMVGSTSFELVTYRV